MSFMNNINLNLEKHLSHTVFNAAFWQLLFQILDNVLGFLRLLILARLLTPADFGLVGVAWLILQILNTFTQTGIHQALIHKQQIEKYLNTAWTYLLLRGIILYVLLFISAPLLSSFFNSPETSAIIRMIGITLLFEGLGNIGTIYFQKNLTFNKQFILQITGNTTDFIVAIGLALIFHNVWAIVLGALANSFVRMSIGYLLSNYRPRIEFDKSKWKELSSYGKWIAGSNVLQFIYSQGDDILVGKILGTTSLGFYQLAYRISNLPATQITHIIGSVMFPAYAKVKDDIHRVGKIYLSVLQVIAFLSFFLGTMIILFAHDFTYLFLGEKWLPMVPAMQILTIWGVIRSIGATTGPVWQAIGKPDFVTKIQAVQVILLGILILPFTYYMGMNGTALAVVFMALIPNFLALVITSNSLKIRNNKIFKILLFPILFSFISYILFGYLQLTVLKNINILNFIYSAVIITFTHLIISLIFNKLHLYMFFNDIIELIPGKLSIEDRLIYRLTKLIS